jgi:hypothetical protein
MGTGRGRRLAIRLAACAIAGIGLTIAVAWWIPFAQPGPMDPTAATSRQPDLTWPAWVPPGWPKQPQRHYVITGPGVRREEWVGLKLGSRSADVWLASQVLTGWPLCAMSYRTAEYQGTAASSWTNGIRVPGREPVPKAIVPIGFALDTIFGTFTYPLWGIRAFIRRRLRRARGRCPACGYDLKGSTSAVCPECGVTPKREGVAEGRGGEEVPSASANDR